MPTITAIYGSPRRRGNTASLLKHAVCGAESAGARVTEIVLRDRNISPCLEIYACKSAGECAIRDDFAGVLKSLIEADAIMLASPIFFYTVSAHTKTMMDRCQSLWVKKHWVLRNHPQNPPPPIRNALFIAAGATHGQRLFDGAVLTVRYFLEALDARLWRTLLVRGVDHEGDIFRHPDLLAAAYKAGRDLAVSRS